MTAKTTSFHPRVLLTFVGSNDPFRSSDEYPAEAGPVLSLLGVEQFDRVHLFYNDDAFLRRASDLLRELRTRGNETGVVYEHTPVADPTDHAALYSALEDRVLTISQGADAGTIFVVSLSSGTPQMQTCWMLLVLGGVLRASMLQVIPPHKRLPGGKIWRDVEFSHRRFPTITPPGPLERKLAMVEQELAGLRAERRGLAREDASGLIGQAPAFRNAVRLTKQFAAYDLPVLLIGETGTGKEEFARMVHFSSRRAKSQFLAINCASLPDELAESELFGHRRGAFTGAIQNRPGIFAEAGEGTVFLDEVGELSPGVQAKLLRVLESGVFRPVGATNEQLSRARIVAATHRDLAAMVADGRFRDDLRYRLNAAEVRIPALRERREDVPILACHFLDNFNARNRRTLRFEPTALSALENAPWPGNVRALRHAVERLAILSVDDIILHADIAQAVTPPLSQAKPTDLPQILPAQPVSLPELLAARERHWIEQAIDRFQGNRSAAARHLGYAEPNFRKKCREYFGRKT